MSTALLLSGCSLLGMVGPKRGAQEMYVSTTGDDNAKGDSPEEPLRSLAVAVNAVADGGTIKMAAGDYSHRETVHIHKSITIEAGLTADFTRPAYSAEDLKNEDLDSLSMLNGHDFFGELVHIYSPDNSAPRRTVSISGLGFTSCFDDGNGAALSVNNRIDLTIDSCEFRWNATYGAAAVMETGQDSVIEINGCYFRSNEAYWSPSAIYFYESTATLTGCTFLYNGTRGHSEGDSTVIELRSENGHSISFANCTFEDNEGSPLLLRGTATKIDLGGNVGFAPPMTEISAVFTGWTTGVASATSVVEGPTTEDGETTMAMENADGSVRIESVMTDATGEGTYTYIFDDYTYEDYTYNGSLTATVSGMPTTPKFEYDGTILVSGGEVESIDYDYTYENSAFSGTITVNDDYVYDLSDDLGL
jgi:hypothetical protein